MCSNSHQALPAQRWRESIPTKALLTLGPAKTADVKQTPSYNLSNRKGLIVLVIE
jgi:hypothetical protein